jgi:hypothetical protein
MDAEARERATGRERQTERWPLVVEPALRSYRSRRERERERERENCVGGEMTFHFLSMQFSRPFFFFFFFFFFI